jgi:ABC-2 type transport system permease protein
MRAAAAIAQVQLVRVLRDRTGLFFIFLLPVVLILVLGTMYGGRVAPRLGVVTDGGGPLAEALVATLESGDLQLEILHRASGAELVDGVASGTLEMGMLVPAGYDEALRSGGAPTITLYGQPASSVSALRSGVEAAVAAQAGLVRAARLAGAFGGIDFDGAMATAGRVAETLPGIAVVVQTAGEGTFPTDAGPFALGAQSQLVLFMFLTSMTAATQLIITRQLGVSRRMVATPTPIPAILAGELAGRFAVAMLQGVFIVLVSSLIFGVDWGDPLAATALVLTFAFVCTGVALAIGVFANNADQAGTVGVFAGMLLGALGGAMVPLELFGEPLRTIAHLTPHAWAIVGFRSLVFDGGSISDIALPLAVLLGMGIGLTIAGTWGLRRALTSGGG